MQYLHLKDVYTVGTKVKKEQQVFVKGGTGYVYKQAPDDKAAYDSQQAINTTRQGSLVPHFYGGNQDNRGFRWSAKPPPPVRVSFDTIMEDWDRTHVASQARVQAAQAHRLGEMLRVDAERAKEASRQQTLMKEQVLEAVRLTKHTQVIGRIQRLFNSTGGREAMRNMKSEKDKSTQ